MKPAGPEVRATRGGRAAGFGAILRGRSAWIYLASAAVIGTSFIATGQKWLLPFAQSLLAWPVLLLDIREGRLGDAVRHMLFWALAVSLCTVEATVRFPLAAEQSILRGAAYREEMYAFIRTGAGAEGSPALFVPQHIRHYLGTLVLSGLTLGLAGLTLGSVLLNYMNFYVGELIREGARPALGAAFGWPVWSVLRVVSFTMGSIAMAHLTLGKLLKRGTVRPSATARLMLWSFALFLADLLVKAFLAHSWRRILLRALEP